MLVELQCKEIVKWTRRRRQVHLKKRAFWLILTCSTVGSFTSTKIFVNHASFCIINAVLTLVTICLNSITALAYWKSTELKKKTPLFLIMGLSKVTKGRLLKCSIVLWLFTTALVVAFVFYPFDVLVKFLTVEMLLIMAALVYIYSRIYFTSGRSFENFRRTNRRNSSPQNQGTQSERKQNLRNKRLVKSCFIVVMCYCTCFLPFAILNVSFIKSNRGKLISPWLLTLNLSNATFNSLIFFWSNKLLRREAKRVLKQMLC